MKGVVPVVFSPYTVAPMLAAQRLRSFVHRPWRRSFRSVHWIIAAVMIAVMSCCTTGDTWPGWRGHGEGVSTEKDLPLHWNGSEGVVWKTRIVGEGTSSPIVWDDRIFLTAAAEVGRTRLVLCLDAASGDVIWQTPFAGQSTQTYPHSGHAAPTPVTDGERVYAFFDTPGLVALDFSGEELWRKELGPFRNSYNMASSPVLYEDMVILACDQQGPSFIAAFDRSTGEERWRTDRKGGYHYSTPLIFTHDGQKQMVVNGDPIVSYNPDTGDQTWWCFGMKHATTPTALYEDGLVYVTCGRNGPSKIIDPSGKGDITETHVRMHLPTGGPYVPSPLLHKGLFMVPGDDGRIMFINQAGKKVVRHKIRRAKFFGSPISAGDRIYWVDDKGRTYVLDTTGFADKRPRIEVIAENQLDEGKVYSSPAAANGRLYIRTAKHLYCIAGGVTKLEAPQQIDLPDDLDELMVMYRAELKGEFDNTRLRLDMVDKVAEMDDPRAPQMLAYIVHADGHWDVCETAVSALGGFGEQVVPELIKMFDKGQPFYKTVAAEHLAEIKSPTAVPVLIKAIEKNDRQVRVACIKALGQTAAEHAEQGPIVAEAMVKLLDDPEGVIRHASVEALGKIGEHAGPHRDAVIAGLRKRISDENPLVSEAARAVLKGGFGVAVELE